METAIVGMVFATGLLGGVYGVVEATYAWAHGDSAKAAHIWGWVALGLFVWACALLATVIWSVNRHIQAADAWHEEQSK